MIHIICGENNQGKTKKIKSIYNNKKEGDGFIAQKIFKDSIFCGYELIRLSTEESVTQAMVENLFPEKETPVYKQGNFLFFKESFVFADSIIEEIISNKTNPVFIDEIGPLELRKEGYHKSLKKIFKEDRTIYITARNSLIFDIIDFYSIKDYSLIKV